MWGIMTSCIQRERIRPEVTTGLSITWPATSPTRPRAISWDSRWCTAPRTRNICRPFRISSTITMSRITTRSWGNSAASRGTALRWFIWMRTGGFGWAWFFQKTSSCFMRRKASSPPRLRLSAWCGAWIRMGTSSCVWSFGHGPGLSTYDLLTEEC